MTKLSRRGFLKASGGGVAAAGSAALLAPQAARAATTNLPEVPVAKASRLKPGVPVNFNYPDSGSPCVVLKASKRVPGGVGPNGDIVAYSTLCTHMGCPLMFEASSMTFKCPCHFSQFDAEMEGQMIVGQATEDLPRILLRHDADGQIHAVGIEGLVYARVSNKL